MDREKYLMKYIRRSFRSIIPFNALLILLLGFGIYLSISDNNYLNVGLCVFTFVLFIIIQIILLIWFNRRMVVAILASPDNDVNIKAYSITYNIKRYDILYVKETGDKFIICFNYKGKKIHCIAYKFFIRTKPLFTKEDVKKIYNIK